MPNVEPPGANTGNEAAHFLRSEVLVGCGTADAALRAFRFGYRLRNQTGPAFRTCRRVCAICVRFSCIGARQLPGLFRRLA